MELVDVLNGIRLALAGMELAGFLFGLDKSFVPVVVVVVLPVAVVAAHYLLIDFSLINNLSLSASD
jgi:H+/gluconate symporter-like permease